MNDPYTRRLLKAASEIKLLCKHINCAQCPLTYGKAYCRFDRHTPAEWEIKVEDFDEN